MSLYQASLAPCFQMLDALSAVLGKAASYAAERGIDPSVLLQSRLYPDMLPLVRQVQIATDGAKAGGARLAGVDNPSFRTPKRASTNFRHASPVASTSCARSTGVQSTPPPSAALNSALPSGP